MPQTRNVERVWERIVDEAGEVLQIIPLVVLQVAPIKHGENTRRNGTTGKYYTTRQQTKVSSTGSS